MQILEDGTMVGLPAIKSPTHPKNMASEDTLMMKEVLTKSERELLSQCLLNYIEEE